RLLRVAQADREGRPGLETTGFPAGDWLLERARFLDVERAKPVAIVMGRHLLELGLQPGPRFKEILDACYEAQLDGLFHDLEAGLAFLRDHLQGHPQGS
ncbi:MAG: polynucleotide adenylyltransferase, partial [Elusimicrobiota bacterium]